MKDFVTDRLPTADEITVIKRTRYAGVTPPAALG
jgi:hypothetical protein